MDSAAADTTPARDKLGAELLDDGVITQAQLDQALEFRATTGGELGEILTKLGMVDEDEVTRRVARTHRMHFVDPDSSEVDLDLLARIPRQVIERHQILPLKGEHGVLLAVTDPNDFQAIDEVQFLTNRPVETALANRGSIRKAIQRYYQRAEGRRKLGLKPDEKLSRELLAVVHMPEERLLKALVLTMVANGEIDLKELLANAIRVEGQLGVGKPAPARKGEPKKGE
jgi:type IV pilus assembly protein PilB